MTDKLILDTSLRTLTGKKARQLFKEGWAIGNVSKGDQGESTPLQIKASLLEKTLQTAGESTLIYLKLEGQKNQIPVLIAEVQQHPITGAFRHISFRQVSLKEKVSAEVPVELEGEVSVDGALLITVKDTVEVEALPTDLPSSIKIDVSKLTEVGQGVSLADLKLDEGVQLVLAEDQNPAETMLVMIQAEQQEEPEETSSEGTEMPEVIGKTEDQTADQTDGAA